ncbi:MAG: hypothetical protein Q7T05_04005 [Dehalococcoidia bacterium]|nr:hypothetical protein [Dehalococcoidia bacterium]
MSYCRWSDADYQCDVYCYQSDAGYQIHVANNRPVFTSPLPPPVGFDDTDAWFKRHTAVRVMLAAAKRRPIGLPFDGASFCHDTPGEASDWLRALRDIGYHVPQYAIDALMEEE